MSWLVRFSLPGIVFHFCQMTHPRGALAQGPPSPHLRVVVNDQCGSIYNQRRPSLFARSSAYSYGKLVQCSLFLWDSLSALPWTIFLFNKDLFLYDLSSGFGSHFAHWPWQYSWPYHCEKKHSIWMSLNTKVKSSPQIIKLCLFGVYSTVKSPVYEVFQFYWTKKNHHVIFFLVNNNQCKCIYTSTRPIQPPTVG